MGCGISSQKNKVNIQPIDFNMENTNLDRYEASKDYKLVTYILDTYRYKDIPSYKSQDPFLDPIVKGNAKQAIEYITPQVEQKQKLLGSRSPIVSYLYYKLGFASYFHGDYEESIRSFSIAFQGFLPNKHKKNIADTYIWSARAKLKLGQRGDQQIEHYLDAKDFIIQGMKTSFSAHGKNSIELLIAINVMIEVNEVTGLDFDDFTRLVAMAEENFGKLTQEREYLPYQIRILLKSGEIFLSQQKIQEGLEYIKRGLRLFNDTILDGSYEPQTLEMKCNLVYYSEDFFSPIVNILHFLKVFVKKKENQDIHGIIEFIQERFKMSDLSKDQYQKKVIVGKTQMVRDHGEYVIDFVYS